MSRFFEYFLILAAFSLTVLGGIVHGRLSNRWGLRSDTTVAAQRLRELPAQFGDWRLEDSSDLPKAVVDTLQCTGYLNRRYSNEVTGEVVNVAVLLGPAGPISVHTPEICYSSREFTMLGDREKEIMDVTGEENAFWSLTFESNGVEKSLLRVYYAWCVDGRWEATDSPRFAFAGRPFLYKLQLAAQVPPGVNLKTDDPCRSFLREFLPALQQHVFMEAAR